LLIRYTIFVITLLGILIAHTATEHFLPLQWRCKLPHAGNRRLFLAVWSDLKGKVLQNNLKAGQTEGLTISKGEDSYCYLTIGELSRTNAMPLSQHGFSRTNGLK